MKIENTINEVCRYFKNKVLVGDYEFKEVGTSSAEITIDGKYNFSFFYIDNINRLRFCDESFLGCGIINSGLEFEIEEEKKQAFQKLQDKIKVHKSDEYIRQKEEEIKKIQKELEQLQKAC